MGGNIALQFGNSEVRLPVAVNSQTPSLLGIAAFLNIEVGSNPQRYVGKDSKAGLFRERDPSVAAIRSYSGQERNVRH